jgi:hypothetical protein
LSSFQELSENRLSFQANSHSQSHWLSLDLIPKTENQAPQFSLNWELGWFSLLQKVILQKNWIFNPYGIVRK